MNSTIDTKKGTILIEIKDLRKSFPVGDTQVEVLKNINMTVEQGEFVIIFGPSGCGKSTLLHTLLGLEPPTTGTVVMENKDIYSFTEDERSLFRRHKVGMVYQQPLWISSFSIIENLSFPLYLLGMDDITISKKASEALTIVGMEKWANYTPTELSGGQQQKVSLARALMIDPLLIVADEPTGNLDTVSGQELLERFLKLIDIGKTIVMVTHDLEYLKYATKIFHIVDGEIVETFRPDKKSWKNRILGKKEIGGNMAESNVRDKDFLKNLHL